ncbi:MAG: tail tape measure protein [Parasphingorhabdus sp.]|uniref:tail tape measure protein n=1 Tax=Parasphingorhabdus sp. TaxID=2709688 RepID=UPI003297C068
MDEEIERLVIAIRADTKGFSKDVADMQALVDGPFSSGMERAGSVLQSGLGQAIRQSSLDLEDFKAIALTVMADIANAAISSGLGSIFGASNGGLLGLGRSILSAALGAPGRATGGPVVPGRAYTVGESGPEVFVPSESGQIASNASLAAPTDIRLTVNISDHGQGSAPDQIHRSSRQIARAVRRALAYREG